MGRQWEALDLEGVQQLDLSFLDIAGQARQRPGLQRPPSTGPVVNDLQRRRWKLGGLRPQGTDGRQLHHLIDQGDCVRSQHLPQHLERAG